MLDWWEKAIHIPYEKLIVFLDDIGILIAFGTFLFALLTWWNGRSLNKDITIRLTLESQSKVLIQTIKRRHFSRSEVQGLLGNIYVDPQDPTGRYNISYLRTKAFAESLEAVQNGERDELEILLENESTYNNFLIE